MLTGWMISFLLLVHSIDTTRFQVLVLMLTPLIIVGLETFRLESESKETYNETN